MFDIKINKTNKYFGNYQFEFKYDVYSEKIKIPYENIKIEDYNYYFILFNEKNIEKIKEYFKENQYDLIEFKVNYLYIKNKKKIKYIDKIFFNKINDNSKELKDKINLNEIFSLENGITLRNKIENLIEVSVSGLNIVSKEVLDQYYKHINIYNKSERRDKEIIYTVKNSENLKLLIEKLLNRKIVIIEFILKRSQFLNKYRIDGLKFNIKELK